MNRKLHPEHRRRLFVAVSFIIGLMLVRRFGFGGMP
jgi:hypothetical protein